MRHWQGARRVSSSQPEVRRCGRTDYSRSKHRHASDCHYTILERPPQDFEDLRQNWGRSARKGILLCARDTSPSSSVASRPWL
jgi:hypothetical protein